MNIKILFIVFFNMCNGFCSNTIGPNLCIQSSVVRGVFLGLKVPKCNERGGGDATPN